MNQLSLAESLSEESLRRSSRISRDEMNLVEFPLAVLSTRTDSNIKTLEFKDSIKGKSGEVINRSWIITGADKFGLPTSSDEEVLLGLLKLTVDSGFEQRKIYFTRYELLRILRWTTEGRSYTRLQRALDRLSGVRIKATNAFYDNESKSHSTRNFGIIDAYEINDGRSTHEGQGSPKPSFFTWSEVIFKSFQVGFIKKLDLSFYLDLKSAVSKRLYRFLDKHFWYRARVDVNLFLLCHEKIGISRNYRYASALRQQLDPALDELKAEGFISNYLYDGRGSSTVVSVFSARGTARCIPDQSDRQSEDDRRDPAYQGASSRPIVLREPLREKEREESSSDEYTAVAQLLIERGLKLAQARNLLRGKTSAELVRVRKIIEYFDGLVARESHLVSRSPVGFLYRAVESADTFVLPGEGRGQQVIASVSASRGLEASAYRRSESEARRAHAQSTREADYLVARKKEVERLKQEVEPAIYRGIEAEVRQALTKLQGHISAHHFEETVQHGVEERLLKLFGFPAIEEWSREQTQGRKRELVH